MGACCDGGMDESATESLPARLYLLACDVERGRLLGGDELGYAVRAGALAELEARGCLTDRDGRAVPRPGARTGDPVLDAVLRIVPSRPRKWKSLVAHDHRRTRLLVEGQLEKAGAITVEKRPWHRKRVRVRNKTAPERLRAEAAEVFFGTGPVGEIPPLGAALAAMAALARLSPEFSLRARIRQRGRLGELVRRAGVTGPALKSALDTKRAAAANAGGGGG